MMLATTRCRNRNCRELYDAEVLSRNQYIRCPVCSQRNEIDWLSDNLTGRCHKQECQRPIDDHDMQGRCPIGRSF
jgi:hypothetical protein